MIAAKAQVMEVRAELRNTEPFVCGISWRGTSGSSPACLRGVRVQHQHALVPPVHNAPILLSGTLSTAVVALLPAVLLGPPSGLPSETAAALRAAPASPGSEAAAASPWVEKESRESAEGRESDSSLCEQHFRPPTGVEAES